MFLSPRRNIGGWQWADTQDGEHRLQQVKRPYRDSNKREWQAHLAIHYNTTFAVDRLEQGQQREDEESANEEQEGQTALSLAQEEGENCTGAAYVRASLLVIEDPPDAQQIAKEVRNKRTRAYLEKLLMELEGAAELQDLIGAFLYAHNNNGQPPPSGDARLSASLPKPYRNLLWYHTAVAVAPGQSLLEYADLKQHFREPVLVRADKRFYGRPWHSDVEVIGQDDQSWFAKLLFIFRYFPYAGSTQVL